MSCQAQVDRAGWLRNYWQLVLGEQGEEREMGMGRREGACLPGDNEVLEKAENHDDLSR